MSVFDVASPVEHELSIHGCPRRSPRWDPVTGERLIAECGSASCPWCGVRKCFRRRRGVVVSQPTTLLTFTKPGRVSWPLTRDSMKHVRTWSGASFEWTWTVEANESGAHVHALARGDLDEVQVLHAKDRAGFAREVSFDPIEPSTVRTVAGYPWKGVLRTRPGTRDAADALDQHLDLNGGRLSHQSRGFYQRGTPR